jgi:hypothetical protein
MSFVYGFFGGLISALTLSNTPLYRYPYRNSQEAFRSDWKRIGKDIEMAQQNLSGGSERGKNE